MSGSLNAGSFIAVHPSIQIPDWTISTSVIRTPPPSGKRKKKKIQPLRKEGKKTLSQPCIRFASA